MPLTVMGKDCDMTAVMKLLLVMLVVMGTLVAGDGEVAVGGAVGGAGAARQLMELESSIMYEEAFKKK